MAESHHLSTFSLDIAEMALRAMLYEVSCFPSPGLVSPVSNGAHRDMDFYSFLDSAAAINRYFMFMAETAGKCPCAKQLLPAMREVGVQAERAMFRATRGINTHKGMLFSMGITVAASAMAARNQSGFASIRQIIRQMCSHLVPNELGNLKTRPDSTLSNGERAYLEHKITGIRGEAENGFPIVFDFALDMYQKAANLSQNDRLIQVLLGIMQYCQDTTIIHRSSVPMLEWVQSEAKRVIDLGGMHTDQGRREIELLDRSFIKKNISPGGSADLLGITVFLSQVREYIDSGGIATQE